MKPKTKKILASCALSLPLLASSVLCPILSVKQANADSIQDGSQGFHTQDSIFSYYGFEITLKPRMLSVDVDFSTPFVPYLPLGGDMQSLGYWQDYARATYMEDMPYINASLIYNTYFDMPSYESEGGIVDDEITMISCRHSLQCSTSTYTSGYAIEPAFTIGFDSPRLVVLNEVLDALGQLEYEFYTPVTNYPLTLYGQLVYEILAVDEDGNSYWDEETLNVDNLEISSFTHGIRPEAYPNTQGYNLVRNFKLTQYATPVPDANDGTWWDMGLGYGLNSNDDFSFLTDFTRRNVSIADLLDMEVNVTITPDVGTLLWSPVEKFLDTEFMPNFRFGDLCLIALGISAFFMFLKIWMGG